MKIAVIGSRTFNDYKLLAASLHLLGITDSAISNEIISGGARGADRLAENFAENLGIKCTVIKPDWGRYGKAAGIIRNQSIIDAADMVVAFWDGHSKGTKNSIDRAAEAKIPTLIVYF